MITIAAVVLAAALGVASGALASPARILISTPHAWQVVQRDANGRADIVVSGRCLRLRGGVRVAWGGCRGITRCDRAGRFRIVLRDVPAGQATLWARSVRRPHVCCGLEHVGVGDIYVIAGQSNASGRSAYRFAYDSSTWSAAMFGNDYRWHELRDPVDSPAGQVDVVSRDMVAGGSVWPEVATVLLAKGRVPLAFIPCARDSTSIASWEPGLRPPGAEDTLYGSMARRIAAAGGRVRAVLWWQGERDARFRTPGAVYEERLRDLAANVWQDFQAPLVVAQIGDYSDDYPQVGVDAVRLAQQHVWGTAHIVQGPVLYDIDLHGDVHFKQREDVATAADRWAAAILQGVLHRAAGSTPRLVRAVCDGDEVVLTADAPLAGGADLGGFTVRTGGVTLPIAGAFAEGDTVHLELGASAEGTLDVSLGSGRSAAGSAVPTDTSAWRLPMLPFVDRPVAAAR
jgi:hypothetical protein